MAAGRHLFATDNHMFVRLVYESFRRQKRRKLLAGVAITLGWV